MVEKETKERGRKREREEFNNFGRADEFSSLELFARMDGSNIENEECRGKQSNSRDNGERGNRERNVCHGYWVVSERRDKTTTKTTKLSFHSKKKKKRKKKKKKKNRRDQEEKQIK